MNKYNPATTNIQIWAKRISDSDREAFNSLFRDLYPKLVPYAYRFTGSKATAEDMVQEAFVKLWEHRNEIDHKLSINAYMYRIVRNMSLNYLRDHAGKTERLENRYPEPTAEAEFSGENNEINERKLKLLNKWIKDLPERQREAFQLSRFEGLHHDEIAEVMDISENTVNNHLVAALQTLRDRYDQYFGNYDKNTG